MDQFRVNGNNKREGEDSKQQQQQPQNGNQNGFGAQNQSQNPQQNGNNRPQQSSQTPPAKTNVGSVENGAKKVSYKVIFLNRELAFCYCINIDLIKVFNMSV